MVRGVHPRTILLATPLEGIYARLAAAVRRRYPDTTETWARDDETILISSNGIRLAVALVQARRPLPRLVGDLRADAVLGVDLGATQASDAAAVGDVLVPAMVEPHGVGLGSRSPRPFWTLHASSPLRRAAHPRSQVVSHHH
jgi:hypothetical protein